MTVHSDFHATTELNTNVLRLIHIIYDPNSFLNFFYCYSKKKIVRVWYRGSDFTNLLYQGVTSFLWPERADGCWGGDGV